MKKLPRIHKVSVRLRNNAGLEVPVCQRNARLLGDYWHWDMVGRTQAVDCKNCLRILKKNPFA